MPSTCSWYWLEISSGRLDKGGQPSLMHDNRFQVLSKAIGSNEEGWPLPCVCGRGAKCLVDVCALRET